MIKLLISIFALILTVVLITTKANATNYFVDCASGNDSNNGQSQISPWLTIGKINTDGFKAGDIIAFKGNSSCEYRDNLLGYWVASTTYSLNQIILDSNGNVERVTVAGISKSGAHPTWNATEFGTTTDNTVTWENYGPDLYTMFTNPYATTQPTAANPVIWTSYGDQPAWISGDLCAGQLTGNCSNSVVPNWTNWSVYSGSIYYTPWPVRPYAVYLDNEQGWPSLRAATCITGPCLSQGPGGATIYPSGSLNVWSPNTSYSIGDAVHGGGGGSNPAVATSYTVPYWFTAGSTGTSGTNGISTGCGIIGGTCSDGSITWTNRGLSLGEVQAMSGGTWYWDGTYLYIWMADRSNPANHVVEISDKYYGIYLSTSTSDHNYFTFQNLYIRHSCSGINMNNSDVSGVDFAGLQVLNSTITQTGTGKVDDGEFCNPILYAVEDTASPVPASNFVVARNIISYGGGHGGDITLLSASGATVTDNDVSHCNHVCINMPTINESSPIITNGVTIARNIVHDSQESAFPKGGPAPHPTTDSNDGIYGEYIENALVVDNLIYNLYDPGGCQNNGTCDAIHYYHPSGPINISNNVAINVNTCFTEGNLGSTWAGLTLQNNLCALGNGQSIYSQDWLISDPLASPVINGNHLTNNIAGNIANYQSTNYNFSAWQGLGYDLTSTLGNWQSWLPPGMEWIYSSGLFSHAHIDSSGLRNGASSITQNTVTSYNLNGAATSTAAFALGANSIYCAIWTPPVNISPGHMYFNVTTLDATTTDYYDDCVYTYAGNLVADFGTGSQGLNQTGTGVIEESITQGTVTFTGGTNYLVCTTGNATTAIQRVIGSVISIGTATTSTNGQCPSTIIPSSTYTLKSQPEITFVP